MSDDTTPQDDAAMSPASAGSVGEPVAWAVYSHWYAAPYIARDEQEAKRVRKGTDWIVPLYRQPQPTLTDEEREAVERAAEKLATQTPTWQQNVVSVDAEGVRLASILRAMLERTA